MSRARRGISHLVRDDASRQIASVTSFPRHDNKTKPKDPLRGKIKKSRNFCFGPRAYISFGFLTGWVGGVGKFRNLLLGYFVSFGARSAPTAMPAAVKAALPT